MKTRVACVLATLALTVGVSALRAADPIYTAAVLNSNPLVYWTFDEASGDALEQVNGLPDATMVQMGGATRAASGMTAGGLSLGLAGAFDGQAGTRFQATDVVPGTGSAGTGFIASQRWAVEFWLNLGTAGPAYISETYFGGQSNNPGVIYGFMPGFELFSGGRTGSAGTPVMSQGDWHHVVAAFYGNSGGFADNLREVYIDGTLALSDTTSNFSAGHGLDRMAIGNAVTPNENTFNGSMLIDEYAVYELPGGGLLNDQVFVEGIAGHYFAAIPEPSTFALAGITGLLSLAAWRRRLRSSTIRRET